jgi:hypothetical protein
VDVGAVILLCIAAGAGLIALRAQGRKDVVAMFQAANDELRAQKHDLEVALEQERVDCRDRVSRLEGQVRTLQGTIVTSLVAQVEQAVITAVREGVRQANETE